MFVKKLPFKASRVKLFNCYVGILPCKPCGGTLLLFEVTISLQFCCVLNQRCCAFLRLLSDFEVEHFNNVCRHRAP